MNAIYKNAVNRQELCFADDPAACVEILVSYKQRGQILLQKRKADLRIEEDRTRAGREHWTASWEITPEETMRFSDRYPLFLQALRITADGVQEPGRILEIDVIDALDHTLLREGR